MPILPLTIQFILLVLLLNMKCYENYIRYYAYYKDVPLIYVITRVFVVWIGDGLYL